MYRFMAVDPGKGGKRPSIGVACWNHDVQVSYMQQLYKDQFDMLLDKLEAYDGEPKLEAVICESYRIDPRRPQGGQKVETIQVIGQIKDFCRRKKIRFVEQPSSLLNVAQKWSGVKIPENHNKSDHIAAYNHGHYWLVKNGFLQPRVLETKKGG